MRKAIGWCVAQAYRLCGARWRAVRWHRRHILNAIPVVFHAAKPEEVRAILQWFKDRGLLSKMQLTFDDGWREFKDTLVVLEEFGKRAILFIAPGEIIRGRIWTDGLSVPERQALYEASEEERVAAGAYRGERRLLTVDEVKAIAKHPLVEIGNHTWSHLSAPDRPLDFTEEVDRAQKTLEEWCGYAPIHFAYPFGRGSKYFDVSIRARDMTPWYTRQGFPFTSGVGEARNMVYEGMSLAENIGRILMAWPKVGETL